MYVYLQAWSYYAFRLSYLLFLPDFPKIFTHSILFPCNDLLFLYYCVSDNDVYNPYTSWLMGIFVPDFEKPIKLSHLIFQEIPVLNIETTVAFL